MINMNTCKLRKELQYSLLVFSKFEISTVVPAI